MKRRGKISEFAASGWQRDPRRVGAAPPGPDRRDHHVEGPGDEDARAEGGQREGEQESRRDQHEAPPCRGIDRAEGLFRGNAGTHVEVARGLRDWNVAEDAARAVLAEDVHGPRLRRVNEWAVQVRYDGADEAVRKGFPGNDDAVRIRNRDGPVGRKAPLAEALPEPVQIEGSHQDARNLAGRAVQGEGERKRLAAGDLSDRVFADNEIVPCNRLTKIGPVGVSHMDRISVRLAPDHPVAVHRPEGNQIRDLRAQGREIGAARCRIERLNALHLADRDQEAADAFDDPVDLRGSEMRLAQGEVSNLRLAVAAKGHLREGPDHDGRKDRDEGQEQEAPCQSHARSPLESRPVKRIRVNPTHRVESPAAQDHNRL